MPPQSGGPQGPGNIFEVPPDPNAGKRKFLVLLWSIIGVVVLAGIFVGLYIALVVLKPEPVLKPETKASLSSEQLTSRMKQLMRAEYPLEELKKGEGSTPQPTLVTQDAVISPAYTPDGYQYKVQYDSNAAFSYTLTVPPEPEVKPSKGGDKDQPAPAESDPVVKNERSAADIIRAVLTDESMSVLKDGDTKSEKATKVEAQAQAKDAPVVEMYTRHERVCEVTTVIQGAIEKGEVHCGEIAKLRETAALVQPFADSLTTVTPETTLRNLKEVESDAGGYDRATLDVVDGSGSKAVGYFYKKGAGRWLHLTTSAAAVLPCGTFVSLDQQRAYLHTQCANGSKTDGTVQITAKK